MESPEFVSPHSPFVQKWFSEEGEKPFYSPENKEQILFFESEDPEYRDIPSPHESVRKSVSKTVVVKDDVTQHQFTVETSITEHTEGPPVEPPKTPVKKCMVLVKTHGEYTDNPEADVYDVPEGVTVNYLSGAPPGECNMVSDVDGQHWIEFFEDINPDMPDEFVLRLVQEEGRRMKKNYLKQALQFKLQGNFAPGYTRRAGWILHYGLKKIPELILTPDERWQEQVFMLQSDDAGLYRKGSQPWKMVPGRDDMSQHSVVHDLIDAGFTHITLIVLACHVWKEDMDDRRVRRLSRTVMEMMNTYSDKVVQPTSPDFLITTGRFKEGDAKRKEDAAVAAKDKAVYVETLKTLQRYRNKEDRQELARQAEERKEIEAQGGEVVPLTEKEAVKLRRESMKGETSFQSYQEEINAAATVRKGGTRKKKRTRKSKTSKRYRQSKKMKPRSY